MNPAVVVELLAGVERPPDDPGWTGASDAQLRELGMPVPPDLADWLRVCNGVLAGPGGIYGIGTAAEFLDIRSVLRIHPSWRDAGWISVAGDGTGNHYVIDTSHTHLPTDAIFFVDVMDDPSALTYIAASTLEHFLIALLRKELGDRRWPFDQSYVATTDPTLLTVRPPALLPWNA